MGKRKMKLALDKMVKVWYNSIMRLTHFRPVKAP